MSAITWTDAARRAFIDYADSRRNTVGRDGADPNEVIEDWQRHIEEDAVTKGLPAVTEAHVAAWIALFDAGSDTTPPPPAKVVQRPDNANDSLSAPGTGALILMVLFGILLPALVLALELGAQVCAQVLFDPIPTWWHVALVALVPIANLTALVYVLKGATGNIRSVAVLNAAAAATALCYSLMFLPIAPFAAIGIIFYGIGLLPLSPYLGLATALYLRKHIRRGAGGTLGGPGIGVCTALVILSVSVLEIPKTCTRVGIQMAASNEVDVRARGVRLLRRWGNETLLLRRCYLNTRPVGDAVGFTYRLFTKPVPSEEVRKIYYRVTGTPYNAVEPPTIRSLRGAALTMASDFDFDQGGDAVASRVKGLSLKESRFDVDLRTRSGTSYSEWTMVFENVSGRQREARARVQLPPGGVVSRLTLWIEGEPREAAFGGRSQVKTAYKQVVQQRRDPVLVTTIGPDQVLVQCFPVPPGGTMKARIGVTAPLVTQGETNRLFRLPCFREENFAIPDTCQHGAWIESDAALSASCPALKPDPPGSSALGFALRGSIDDALLRNGAVLATTGPGPGEQAWVKDSRADRDDVYVVQSPAPLPVPLPDRIVVVVDGSRRMAAHIEEVCDGLAQLHDTAELAMLLAGDTVHTLCEPTRVTAAQLEKLRDKLKTANFEGGCDNLPALTQGWDLAAEKAGGQVLWIHATQPFRLGNLEGLTQRLERRPGGPRILDLQCDNGPNLVGDDLCRFPPCDTVSRMDGTAATLTELAGDWRRGSRLVYSRRRMTSDTPPRGHESDLHIARLWANDEVARLMATRSSESNAAAVKLAMTYQLVTPVSGAVVLENQAQYKQAGLEPVDGVSTPAVVPEPEAWVLMIIGIAAIIVTRYRHISRSFAGRARGHTTP